MRVVIDTNVLLSGLIWHGPPHALIAHAKQGNVTLISSPPPLPRPVSRDPNDDALTLRHRDQWVCAGPLERSAKNDR